MCRYTLVLDYANYELALTTEQALQVIHSAPDLWKEDILVKDSFNGSNRYWPWITPSERAQISMALMAEEVPC